jgi:hypothetical protein
MQSDRIRNNSPLVWLLLSALALLLALAGCMPLLGAPPTPLPSLTPTSALPTPTATATVVWFPPTATFTPFPTSAPVQPTPEMRPAIGSLVLAEDFNSAQDWGLAEVEGGSVRLGKNELTIAISKQRTYLSSLRITPLLADFYVEMTASANFCRGLDEYGLILRAASAQDFYRFGVTCDGQVRLDRIYRGQGSSPYPLQLSGAVPIGAPTMIRLGVWASGAEMRFFIDDEHQFTVLEGTIPSGVLGVFARSASDEPLTVNFSALSIWEINP